jgi:hypothetical protein
MVRKDDITSDDIYAVVEAVRWPVFCVNKSMS